MSTATSTAVTMKVVRQVHGGDGTAGRGDTAAAAARQARFGHLPERVRFADMVQEQAEPRDPARDAYDAAGSLISYSCLAVDLGL
ncbi:hypothetical protein [Streptomyces sp. NPDC020983]|uniref:hypothetical protein n=1 Tax=Streptomyces sp. NPDC020983 TaxID=3365106 RepID=UPI00379A516D